MLFLLCENKTPVWFSWFDSVVHAVIEIQNLSIQLSLFADRWARRARGRTVYL